MDDFSPEKDEFLKEFYIPSYIFLPELPTRHPSFVPSCPVVVFINTKSGGQLGSALLATYCNLLNKLQVLNFMPRDTDTREIYQSILLAKNVISRLSTWKRKLPTRLQVEMGMRNPGIDCQSVKSFLEQVMKAREMKIDRQVMYCS
ncbi:hypothetical protein BHE74_00042583 [Ensete ventricosum]|nr:hypothetical protein BHE74_00042583 [Ensete ventricosum]